MIKTGPGWGEQPGPAGLTTVKGRFGGFVLSPQPKKGALHADGRQSPQPITTTEENVFKLLMIPDSEVGLGDRGLVTIRGALGLPEQGLCSGAANRSDTNSRKSDGNRGLMSNCEMLRGMTASTPVNCMVGRVAAGRSLPL